MWEVSCGSDQDLQRLFKAADAQIDEAELPEEARSIRKAIKPSDLVPFPWCDNSAAQYRAECEKFRPQMDAIVEIFVQGGPTLVCIHVSENEEYW
jgi:hypothetical protein